MTWPIDSADRYASTAEGWWNDLSYEAREIVLDDLEYSEGELAYGWDIDAIDQYYDELNDIAQEDIDRAYEQYGERVTE